MVSIHRVTQSSMSNQTLRGLQASLSRTQDLQNQLSTGRKLNRPSDDPAGLATTMQLRAQQSQDNTFLSAIGDATDRLNTADSALQNIAQSIRTAKNLMVQAQSGAQDSASRNAIATQLEAIQKSVIDAYNSTYGDRPVFGGTAPGAQAVASDGTYLGDDGELTARIGRNIDIRTDVKGSESGADVLPGLLGQAAANIRAGAMPAAADDQNALDAVLNTVLTSLADVGARVSQIQTTKDRITSEQIDLTARITEIESADLPETIMQLSSSQVAYQSALGAAAKIIQTSLLDYLK